MASRAQWWIVGAVGGVIALALLWLAMRKADEVSQAIRDELAGSGGGDAGGALPTFQVRLTGYWPFTATDSERLMEGGVNDRKGHPLHTLEMHLADPIAHPYVSVSGDDAIFPYGQRLIISAWPNAVFRVVDTGGHFRGLNKVYRVFGREPLDICVNSSATVVPKEGTSAQIVVGDNFAGGKDVLVAGLQGQTVTDERAF